MIVSGDQIGAWVCEKIGSEWFNQGTFCIGEQHGDEIVSGVIYDKYNKASIQGTIATVQSFSREFIRSILDYPFNVLRVHCIIISVSTSNNRSLRFVKHLGFKQIAIIPQANTDGDMVIFSLIRNDCNKFLE